MTPTILTTYLPRLKKCTGIQITATIRPDLGTPPDYEELRARIGRLIKAGTSHFRLNLSHFKPDDPNVLKKAKLTRAEFVARWRNLVRCLDRVIGETGANVFIMLDTAGPEFRVAKIMRGEKPLQTLKKKTQCLLAADDSVKRQAEPVIYLGMPAGFESFFGEREDVVGHEIAFKDGDCTAVVVQVLDEKLLKIELKHDLTMTPGSNIKANFPGFELRGVVPVSARDREHLDFFLRIPRASHASKTVAAAVAKPGKFIPIHYVAQSFVQQAEDLIHLDANLHGIHGIAKPLIIPKIETAQAVSEANLRGIIESHLTAAVMVARGDLGSECKRWMVPSKQREIIRVAHSCLKPVLVATEVYGSMGKYPEDAWQPNRGEVLDLRHALEAGVDGIVFSAETGARLDPETTVAFAVEQAEQDERDIEELDLHKAERDQRRQRMEYKYAELLERPIRVPQSSDPLPLSTLADISTMDWSCAAVYRANIRGAAGVFPFTVSGNTVRDMVHFLPYRPIVALTSNEEALARLALYAHVYPVLVGNVAKDFDVQDLKRLVAGVIRQFDIKGREAFATMPHPVAKASGTDTLVQIICAEE